MLDRVAGAAAGYNELSHVPTEGAAKRWHREHSRLRSPSGFHDFDGFTYAEIAERTDSREMLLPGANLALFPVVDRLGRSTYQSPHSAADKPRRRRCDAMLLALNLVPSTADSSLAAAAAGAPVPLPGRRSWRSISCTRRFSAAISER